MVAFHGFAKKICCLSGTGISHEAARLFYFASPWELRVGRLRPAGIPERCTFSCTIAPTVNEKQLNCHFAMHSRPYNSLAQCVSVQIPFKLWIPHSAKKERELLCIKMQKRDEHLELI